MMKSKLRKTHGKDAIESCKCAGCSGIIMSVTAGICIGEENDAANDEH
jgi:hypothetical protein